MKLEFLENKFSGFGFWAGKKPERLKMGSRVGRRKRFQEKKREGQLGFFLYSFSLEQLFRAFRVCFASFFVFFVFGCFWLFLVVRLKRLCLKRPVCSCAPDVSGPGSSSGAHSYNLGKHGEEIKQSSAMENKSRNLHSHKYTDQAAVIN